MLKTNTFLHILSQNHQQAPYNSRTLTLFCKKNLVTPNKNEKSIPIQLLLLYLGRPWLAITRTLSTSQSFQTFSKHNVGNPEWKYWIMDSYRLDYLRLINQSKKRTRHKETLVSWIDHAAKHHYNSCCLSEIIIYSRYSWSNRFWQDMSAFRTHCNNADPLRRIVLQQCLVMSLWKTENCRSSSSSPNVRCRGTDKRGKLMVNNYLIKYYFFSTSTRSFWEQLCASALSLFIWPHNIFQWHLQMQPKSNILLMDLWEERFDSIRLLDSY